MLRIAEGLDRTHSQSITGLKVRALRGRLPDERGGQGASEIELADAARKADLFMKAFDTDVELAWHPARPQTHGKSTGAGGSPRLHIVGELTPSCSRPSPSFPRRTISTAS